MEELLKMIKQKDIFNWEVLIFGIGEQAGEAKIHLGHL